jgi:hypothetical protein
MLNIVFAATLAATSLSIDQLRLPEPPRVTCGIRTVSVLFVGQPGQRFSFHGEDWTIPASGEIELIAGKRIKGYRVNDQIHLLEPWPLDGFGRRTVNLSE